MKCFLALLAVLALMMPCALAQEGSWGQINTDMTKADGWQQIVQQTGFALGGKTETDTGIFTMDYGSYPCIDGSTVSMAMAMEFAWQHRVISEEDVPGFVFLSTTHSAYEHLIKRQSNGSSTVNSEMAMMDPSHPVDILIGTGPSDEETALARGFGVELIAEPVCLDAFVFITHRDNPVDALTSAQIRAIYKGEITSWHQVGGADKPIIAYRREKNSGSETGMEQLVMRGDPMPAAQNVYVSGDMEGLVRRIGDYANGPSSLGYTYLYYITNLYLDEGVKTLAIDGVTPTAENIRSGAYPFTTAYYGVIRGGDEQKTGGLFLEWMLGEEGQKCIAQAGYITLK